MNDEALHDRMTPSQVWSEANWRARQGGSHYSRLAEAHSHLQDFYEALWRDYQRALRALRGLAAEHNILVGAVEGCGACEALIDHDTTITERVDLDRWPVPVDERLAAELNGKLEEAPSC